jgi:hypothetical protein
MFQLFDHWRSFRLFMRGFRAVWDFTSVRANCGWFLDSTGTLERGLVHGRWASTPPAPPERRVCVWGEIHLYQKIASFASMDCLHTVR